MVRGRGAEIEECDANGGAHEDEWQGDELGTRVTWGGDAEHVVRVVDVFNVGRELVMDVVVPNTEGVIARHDNTAFAHV